MLYTHLSLSFLPIYIWCVFFFLFSFLCYFFWFYWFFWVVVFISLGLILLFFLFTYKDTISIFSLNQFFWNSQFFIYFVVWEVFFFFGIFWSLFWISFSYDWIYLLYLHLINPFGLALFNTFLLLTSSTYGVLFHLNFINNKNDYNLQFCIILGLFFLINQFIEFNLCLFSISDFAFCWIFFLGTGFHGFHVLLGVLFLFIGLIYHKLSSFSLKFYIDCSLLYWHFVDIVWLFLFCALYCILFSIY